MSSEMTIRNNQLAYEGVTYPCVVGRNGISKTKTEGDGSTPAGEFVITQILYRADRISLPNSLDIPQHVIKPGDYWCEDVNHTNYNQLCNDITVSQGLCIDESWFNLCLVLNYNVDPVVSGLGSGIFIHVAKADFSSTRGCIALAENHLLQIVSVVGSKTKIKIR